MANIHETERGFFQSAEPLDTTIDKGVLKGIVTTKTLAGLYAGSVADADTIRTVCRKGLIVVDYDATVYLNAGVPVRTPLVHVTGNDWTAEETYWRMFPDKRPDVAYVPYTSLSGIPFKDVTAEEKLAYFRKNAEVEILPGEAGSIVKIIRWNAV